MKMKMTLVRSWFDVVVVCPQVAQVQPFLSFSVRLRCNVVVMSLVAGLQVQYKVQEVIHKLSVNDEHQSNTSTTFRSLLQLVHTYHVPF